MDESLMSIPLRRFLLGLVLATVLAGVGTLVAQRSSAASNAKSEAAARQQLADERAHAPAPASVQPPQQPRGGQAPSREPWSSGIVAIRQSPLPGFVQV